MIAIEHIWFVFYTSVVNVTNREEIQMAATVYMNTATGEITYSHKEAMSWYRDGNTVNLYREIDGKLKQDDNIKCWIH